jgi:hypothetical protein
MIFFHEYFANRRRSEFMSRHGMSFNGFGGLVICDLVASEFGYLLRYLTDGELDRIGEFEKIREKKDQILSAIKDELEKPTLRESEALGVSRGTAISNMENLRCIIESICDYVDLCRSLDLEIYPDENPDQKFTKNLFLWIGGAVAVASIFSILLGVLDKQSASTMLGLVLGAVGGVIANVLQDYLSKRRKKKEESHD